MREIPAAGGVSAEGQREVEAIPLDEIILAVTDGGRKRVRLMKIDCEGSEFPILLTSRKLHLIDQIVGGFHGFGGDYDPYKVLPEGIRVAGFERLTIHELSGVLRNAGFDVDWARQPPTSHLGIFFVWRSIPAHARFMKRAIALTSRVFR